MHAPMHLRGGRKAFGQQSATRRGHYILAVLLMLAIPLPAASADTFLDEPESFVVELPDSPSPLRGKLAYLEWTASGDGRWLKVPDLSVQQAVLVALHTGDDDPPMTLELRKFHFSAPLRQASTGADGSCSELFRTQGDLFIRVVSRREEQPFSLLLWIDEAQEPAMPPVIVPKGAGR